MPTIATIDVPSVPIAQRIANAFKRQFKPQYDAAVLVNPSITDQAFYKQMVIRFTKEVVAADEAHAAAETARAAAIATANSEINPT